MSVYTKSETKVDTRNLQDNSIGDGDRNTIGEAKNVSISTTDHGAVKAGVKLSGKALDEAFSFGKDALEGAFSFGKDSLSFANTSGERAADVAREATAAAINSTHALANQSAENSRDTINKITGLVQDINEQGEAKTTKLVTWVALAVVAGAVVVAVAVGRK